MGAALLGGALFAWGTPTLLVLLAPIMLLAGLGRRRGALAAVAALVGIATAVTLAGAGPVAAAAPPGLPRTALLMLVLVCAALCALPVAAALESRDATAREVRTLAERFRLVEVIEEVFFQIDAQGRWTYLNPAWTMLSGRPATECLGRPWLEMVSAAEREAVAERVAALHGGRRTTVTQAVRIDAADGPRWVELFLQAADEPGAGLVGTIRDIGDRRRREERATAAHHHAEARARAAALLASTDELTGLPNRRAFLRQLDREIAASVEFNWPLAIAMFDVDHFKRVNDTHGHAVGDEVLREVAARAGRVVRGGDMIGRLGGEEFAVLMPGASATDAAYVAERLRAAMEAPPASGCTLPQVTISVGLAARVQQRSADELLGIADDALYLAKRGGRNRVRVAA